MARPLLRLVLIATLAASAGAQPIDEEDDLRRALTNLAGRVETGERALMGRWRRGGARMIVAGAVLAAYAGAEPWFWLPRPNLVRAGYALGAAGAFVWTVSAATPYVFRVSQPEISRYRTADEMQVFFALPLDEQYLAASQDPELADFVLKVSRAYGFIERGRPGRCMTSDQCAREN